MKKIVSIALVMLMMFSLMAIGASAESKGIMYIITPSTSNPFFGTEQIVGAAKAEELGYEVKCFSHDDDAAKQLEKLLPSFATMLVQMLPSKQFARQLTLVSRPS